MLVEWEYVREFHIKFGHPISDVPIMLKQDRIDKRYKWMMDELNEFTKAEDVVEQADAMIDLMYFALGVLVEMGVKPDEIFKIVHEANMNKLWDDGKPHYDSAGKTVKPQDWESPYKKMKEVIESMRCKIYDKKNFES